MKPTTLAGEKTKGHIAFQRFSSFFSKIYSTELNPLYHLGGISVILFAVACISGIYVFIFYNINPRHAWESVEAISANFFNGWMRNIHRYSSDLLIVFITAHFLHTLLTSKYKRLISWVSGIISVLMVILIGVTGFILVWDQKAKLTGFLMSKLFSTLPIFDPSIAGAFLMNDLSIVGGFFKVALFGHIALSLVVIIIIWIHVMRISKPKIFPPKKLIYYSLIALGIVAIIFPVKSDPAAESSNLPLNTTFDWYYYFGFYLMKLFSVNLNWVILIGSGALLSFIPLIFKRKDNPVVHIDLDLCDGCNLCSYDCPYEAIDMLTRNDERKAILSPEKCVGCGICIGSCDEHAISQLGFPEILLNSQEKKSDVTIYACGYFPEYFVPNHIHATQYHVPCIGSVMPKDVQEILQNNTNKVALLACENCYYRQGKTWTIDRFSRTRPPLFSKKFDASQVRLFTSTQFNTKQLEDFVFPSSKVEEANQLKYKEYSKTKPILATLILTLTFALFIPLSSTTVKFFNPDDKTLIVNFKYISTPTEYKNSSSTAAHMKGQTPMVKRRSPVTLKIFASGSTKLLFEKTYMPRGLRQDIAMFIYTQLVLDEKKVDIVVSETAFADKVMRLKDVPLVRGDGTFVILKDGKLALGGKERL